MAQIQSFFSLDYVEMTDEQFNDLKSSLKPYLIEFQKLTQVGNRELYIGLMRDESKLYDSTDEEGTKTYGLLSVMHQRNPEIIGIWNLDGSELGTTIIKHPAVYNEEELITEAFETIEGTPKYPFKKDVYQGLIPPRIQTDEEGNETSRVEFYDICNFSGFKTKRGMD